jgi:predicted O-linked N-acetylglucosamine transferase (SPINDLY family)
MKLQAARTLDRAAALHSQGDVAHASRLYAQILEIDPDNADALHLFGVAAVQLGRAQTGADMIARSLAIKADQPAAIANLGNAQLALNRPAEALASYDRALTLEPAYALAHHGRGTALAALGQAAEALASFERALLLAPDFVEALNGRGIALVGLGRIPEAIACYDRALRLRPRHQQAWVNRGAAYLDLRSNEQALRDYERAIEILPDCAEAHYGRGAALLALALPDEARASFERALTLAPDHPKALTGRGHVLSESGQIDAAIAAYDRALQLNPGLGVALFSRGIALSVKARYTEAVSSLKRLEQVEPQFEYGLGARLHAQLQQCDWTQYRESVDAIVACVDEGRAVDFPFSFLAVCDSPARQLRCARRFAEKFRAPRAPLWTGERYAHERIRVAYVSADFLEHPTSFLMAGLFEKHDRQRFETIAVSLREDASSPTGRRVRAAFERVIVAARRPEAEVARLLRELEVDIAVDLMGYTGEHRTNIFAHRPAPIQINYLGFPATTGADDIDYIIADEFLIPPERQIDYSERVVYLPECFQANDDRRAIAADAPTRSAMGLPATGFVWCSFHSSYKLNPPLFDVWARLLSAVPDSVLWLVGSSLVTKRNLQREAAARGVAPERLIFAARLPYAQHLARLGLADLCLDTLPFNGGATTSDALWAGVPVVTCAGSSYAARMSGSLLRALQLPELVTDTLGGYEHRALQLARTPQRLTELRARLARNRKTGPVFDTDRFRRHLEEAYGAMVEGAGLSRRSHERQRSCDPQRCPTD